MKVLRNIFAVIGVLLVAALIALLVIPSTVEAQAPYFYSLFVRTKLVNSGYATIADSLRVGSTATFNGGVVANSSLTAGAVLADTNSFALDAAADTVTVTGAAATDIYFVNPIGTAAADSVSAIVIQRTATGFVLHRTAATVETNQKYCWLAVRKR